MTEVDNRSCRAGSWFGVFGSEMVVLLPGGEKDRVLGLWSVVDDGARFEVVLDELVSRGLRTLPDFVLVAASGTNARVLVRGAASVSVNSSDGPVEVTGGDLVWSERSFTGVTSVVASLPDSSAGGDEVPVGPGLTRVGAVTWGAPQRSAPQRSAPRHAAPAAEAEPAPQPDAGPETVATPVAAAASQPPVVPPVPPLPPVPAPEPTPPPTPERAPGPEPVEQAPKAPAADAETGDHPALDHDGMTQVGERVHPAPPGIPGQPQAPSVTARPVARLVFSHGNNVDVDRAILIGRAPEARRFQPGDQPQLVTVASPHQEVSSTHLEIRPGSGVDHGMAIATDLGSTNGTMLMQPGLPPEDLQPGIAVSLLPGAIIDLGDGVTIQVTKP